MSWRDVNGTRAGLGGDEVGKDQLGCPVEEWVLGFKPIKGAPLGFMKRLGEDKPGFAREGFDEFTDDHEGFLAVSV